MKCEWALGTCDMSCCDTERQHQPVAFNQLEAQSVLVEKVKSDQVRFIKKVLSEKPDS